MLCSVSYNEYLVINQGVTSGDQPVTMVKVDGPTPTRWRFVRAMIHQFVGVAIAIYFPGGIPVLNMRIFWDVLLLSETVTSDG